MDVAKWFHRTTINMWSNYMNLITTQKYHISSRHCKLVFLFVFLWCGSFNGFIIIVSVMSITHKQHVIGNFFPTIIMCESRISKLISSIFNFVLDYASNLTVGYNNKHRHFICRIKKICNRTLCGYQSTTADLNHRKTWIRSVGSMIGFTKYVFIRKFDTFFIRNVHEFSNLIDFLSELRAHWNLSKLVNTEKNDRFVRRWNKFRIQWTIWMKIECMKNLKRKCRHQKSFIEYWIPSIGHEYFMARQQIILAFDLLAHEIILCKLILFLLLFNAFLRKL